jgi:Ca2+-binding EF-hand superfamily protein
VIEYKEFRDYFGIDVFTNEPNDVDARILFDEIDRQQTGQLSAENLIEFFNQQSNLISREEGELFLGIASDTGNQSCISYPGTRHLSRFDVTPFRF